MEEPGNLEIATKSVSGKPEGGRRFGAGALELEYGVKTWWTTELYLDGQTTGKESTVFTGYRWENRFRLLPKEHWINPVLYFEFENINGADKSLLEVVGQDGQEDLTGPNDEARLEKKRELEAKLILSSYAKGWTIAENFIAEKNVRHAPFEFGYAAGVSRPLAMAARAERCNFCPENVQVGVEAFGGLGTHAEFGVRDTSHYLAPTVAWTLANGTTFRVSPGFGLTEKSAGTLVRFGVSHEFTRFGRERGASAKDDLPVEAGAKLVERECMGCHGGRTGARAPRLDSKGVAQAGPDALLEILRNGRMRRGMPSFAHLPEAQRRQIVSFLKSRKG